MPLNVATLTTVEATFSCSLIHTGSPEQEASHLIWSSFQVKLPS